MAAPMFGKSILQEMKVRGMIPATAERVLVDICYNRCVRIYVRGFGGPDLLDLLPQIQEQMTVISMADPDRRSVVKQDRNKSPAIPMSIKIGDFELPLSVIDVGHLAFQGSGKISATDIVEGMVALERIGIWLTKTEREKIGEALQAGDKS